MLLGELSKYGLGIAIPLSDNFPFDLIVVADNKLFRVQVKSSSAGKINEHVTFDLTSNNFYTSETKRYSQDEIDIMLCVDLNSYKVYLVDDFAKKRSITIRIRPGKNGQRKNCHWHEDYVLSDKKIEKFFGFKIPDFTNLFSRRISKQFEHICQQCGIEFTNGFKKAKYCSGKCSSLSHRKVERPAKDILDLEIKQFSWRSIGRKYGVSDNAIRKWARDYELI